MTEPNKNDLHILGMLAGTSLMPEKIETEIAWRAKDDDNVECELIRIMKDGKVSWQLSMTKGPFSGYPTIDLDLDELNRLCIVVEDEVHVVNAYPPRDHIAEEVWAERSIVEPSADEERECDGRNLVARQQHGSTHSEEAGRRDVHVPGQPAG